MQSDPSYMAVMGWWIEIVYCGPGQSFKERTEILNHCCPSSISPLFLNMASAVKNDPKLPPGMVLGPDGKPCKVGFGDFAYSRFLMI